MGDAERRRRRLRHQGGEQTREPEGTPATTARVYDGSEPSRRRGAPGDEREGERGLRGLVGSGSSQVKPSAALRARDAARPTEEDLAEAEARVVVVRRNWVPREELPRPPR